MKRLLPVLILVLVLSTACVGDPLKGGGITATRTDRTISTASDCEGAVTEAGLEFIREIEAPYAGPTVERYEAWTYRHNAAIGALRALIVTHPTCFTAEQVARASGAPR